MHASLLATCLASVGVFAAAQAPAPVRQSVEDLLPGSTYAVARFAGLAACSEAAGSLPLAAVVNTFLQKVSSEARAQHLDRGLERAAGQLQQRLQQVGLSPADLRAVLRCPMALAVGRLSVEGMGPSVALVLEPGDHAAAVERCLATLENVLTQRAAAEAEDTTIAGVQVHHLRLPNGPPLFVGKLGGCFVITNSRGYLRDIAEVGRDAAQGLVRTTRLGSLRAGLPEPPLASLFVNAASVTSLFDAHLPYEASDFAKALGLGGLDAIYASTTASSHGGSDLLHLGIGGSEHGLAKALLAEPADLHFAELCSENTVAFACGSMDVMAVTEAFQQFTKLLPDAAGEQLRGKVLRGLGDQLRRHGHSLTEMAALLHAFGTQIGVAVALEKGPKPELLLRLGVREAAPVATLLQEIEAMTGRDGRLEWKSRQVGEHEIRFCNVTLPNGVLKISPCYVLTEGALLCGSEVSTLVRALGQAQQPTTSFAAQPDFQALESTAAGASGVLHLRLFRAAEIGWRTVETWGYPQIDSHQDQIGFGSDALPDAEAMAQALGTSTCLYTVDDDGVTVRSQGTVAIGSLLAAFGALGEDVLGRACGKIY